jgi:transmembrane sensor
MATKEKIEAIYKRYLNNDISREELGDFLDMLHIPEDELTISSLMDGTWQEMFETKETVIIPFYKRNWYKFAAAAAIILFISAGAYFLINRNAPKQLAQLEQRFKNDVAPGGNKAILTLANGTQIILDNAANGTLANQGNTKIIKLDSSLLSYASTSPNTKEVLYNMISTPRGGQYQIVLPDGSKVWLNATSSLKFPTAFVGKNRNVELTGEGYFEIAHNAAKPFNVSVNGVDVQVLGTHFNINAYDDERTIKTTLLEGSVKVSKGLTVTMIKPGEQAQIENNANRLSPQIRVEAVNTDAEVAWKNGLFRFESLDIETIMRQLSRWYDVRVTYDVKTTKHFTGIISRNVNVSEVLKMLELTGEMHFSIDGKKVTVEK